MPHQYEVELHDGTKQNVQVADHQHHEKLAKPALIIGIVAGSLSIAESAVKVVKYIRKV